MKQIIFIFTLCMMSSLASAKSLSFKSFSVKLPTQHITAFNNDLETVLIINKKKNTYINSACHKDTLVGIFKKIYTLQKKNTFRANKKTATYIKYAINNKSKSTPKDSPLGRYLQTLPKIVHELIITCSS